jgi:uncharacterized membrane protein YbhN (UPF0104 family)
MPNFLVGSAYAVSAGLILFAIVQEIAPSDLHFPLLLGWALLGVLLAFVAVLKAGGEK